MSLSIRQAVWVRPRTVAAAPPGGARVTELLAELARVLRSAGRTPATDPILADVARALEQGGAAADIVAALRDAGPVVRSRMLDDLSRMTTVHPLLSDLAQRTACTAVLPTSVGSLATGVMSSWVPALWRPAPGRVASRRLVLEPAQHHEIAARLLQEVAPVIEGTGTQAAVATFRGADFTDLHPYRRANLVDFRFTHEERRRLGDAARSDEDFGRRLARTSALKAAVLQVLGLDPNWPNDWGRVEFRFGRPVLGFEPARRLGKRALLASAAADGDFGIAIALLEESLGASGFVGVGVDVTTDRVHYTEPVRHAVTEAVYKALFRAHPIRQLAKGMVGQVRPRDDGRWELTGLMASVARRLRGEAVGLPGWAPTTQEEPLPIDIRTFRVGPTIVAVALIPAPEPALGPLEPLMKRMEGMIVGPAGPTAGQTGRSAKGLRNAAARALSLVEIDPLERYVEAAHLVIGRNVIHDPPPGGTRQILDGISLLRLIGLTRREAEAVAPTAYSLYRNRHHVEVHKRGVETAGYHWTADHKHGALAATMAAFRDAMALESGQTLLDPMTGDGHEVIQIARDHPGLRILALDLNPEGLRAAATEAEAEGFTDIRFRLHDVLTPLPIADGSVDRVVLNGHSTFGFNEERLRFLFGELLRKVRSGGRIWIDFLPFPRPYEHGHVDLLRKVAREVGILLHEIPLVGDLNAFAFLVIKGELRDWARPAVREALLKGPTALLGLIRHTAPTAALARAGDHSPSLVEPAVDPDDLLRDPHLALFNFWEFFLTTDDPTLEAERAAAERAFDEIIGRLPVPNEPVRRLIASGYALGVEGAGRQREPATLDELERLFRADMPEAAFLRTRTAESDGLTTHFLLFTQGETNRVVTLREFRHEGALWVHIMETFVYPDQRVVHGWEDVRPLREGAAR